MSSFLPCIVKNTIIFTFLQVFFDIFVVLCNKHNGLGKVLFVTIEPTDIDHNFEQNPNSMIYGLEKSFSHNYGKIFQDSGFKIIHHSKKLLTPGDGYEMNYILAGN